MKFRIYLSSISFLFMVSFCQSVEASNGFSGCTAPCNFDPNAPFTSGGGASTSFRNGETQKFDYEALNILRLKTNDRVKNDIEKRRSSSTSAISITQNDFNNFSQPRNTWLDFQNTEDILGFDIGIADNTTAQTWTLPNDLLDYFEFVYYDDFVPVSEVPGDLAFEGANKVLKSYYLDAADNIVEVYQHYVLGEQSVDQIGTSYYYFLDGDEDAFDNDDVKITDVPMALGDGYSFIEQSANYDSGLYLTQYQNTKSVDGYGILETPFGDFDCLRYSNIVDVFTRPDTMSAFTYQYSSTRVGFITKDGFHFSGDVSASSGSVDMGNFQLQFVVASGLLSESDEIQINNDGKGVAINDDNIAADESAALDISSSNLGVLIPRIEESSRPTNPAEGLLIYQYDNDAGFYYFDGFEWLKIMAVVPNPSPPPPGSNNAPSKNKRSKVKKKPSN